MPAEQTWTLLLIIFLSYFSPWGFKALYLQMGQMVRQPSWASSVEYHTRTNCRPKPKNLPACLWSVRENPCKHKENTTLGFFFMLLFSCNMCMKPYPASIQIMKIPQSSFWSHCFDKIRSSPVKHTGPIMSDVRLEANWYHDSNWLLHYM